MIQAIIIDDEPYCVEVLATLLQRYCPDVEVVATCASGEEGIQAIQRHRPQLVFLDVEMPHLNGFELCEKIRELPGYSHTPIIYVTSHTDFENQVRRVGLGGQDLIAKPIFPIELAVKAVMHVIANKLAAPAEARA